MDWIRKVKPVMDTKFRRMDHSKTRRDIIVEQLLAVEVLEQSLRCYLPMGTSFSVNWTRLAFIVTEVRPCWILPTISQQYLRGELRYLAHSTVQRFNSRELSALQVVTVAVFR